jgi:hypothetical protein
MINAYIQDLQLRREDIHSKGRLLERLGFRERSGSGEISIDEVGLFGSNGQEKYLFNAGEEMIAKVSYTVQKPVKSHSVYLALHSFDGRMVVGPVLRPYEAPINGKGEIRVSFRMLPLLKGEYFLSVGFFHNDWVNAYDFRDKYYKFTVTQPPEWGLKGEIYAPIDIEYLNN